MELTMTNSFGFCELNENELMMVDGGGWNDVFDKINPIHAVEFIYQAGQDFGAAGVKHLREAADMGRKCWTGGCRSRNYKG